ncbi:carboxypeptidase B-like [Choristoneura fumiferana]
MPSRRNFIPFIPVENLPFWERHDPKPMRRTASKKHKRSQKKSDEEHPSTKNAEMSNDINLNTEANTKWPKVRSPHGRRRDYVRSTRLAPYQLLQDDPTTTQASKIKSDPVMFGDFNQYSMKNDLEIMLRDIDEANVTVEVITRTVEYNDIVICKITQSKLQSRYFRANEDKYMDEEPEKKIIFIVHGLSAMGFTRVPCLNEKKSFMKLLKYYTAHLDKFDIFLIPMANPDGIGDETLENWNKNKSPQSACLGVALDRNFDVSWNASNSNSCNQQYPGPSPFSELESRAIGDVLHYYSHKIIAYIHVHGGTYDPNIFKGDAVLYPKGFTEVATEDDKYIDIKGEIDEAIRNAGFKVMSVSMETLYNWYGKVHGSSVDFASTIYGVPYAMEFVMQPYEDNKRAEHSDEKISDNVLTEIWKRVIDVVFTNIYKNTHTNDV